MSLYARYVLPVLTDLVMRNRVAHGERVRFVPHASGDVLEVGVGSGLNIPIYGPAVRTLSALDPSPELLRLACHQAAGARFPVTFMQQSAEAIPLADGAVDTVVTTWTLCTIPEPVQALREMRRVLRADGRLIFVEHGRAPDPAVVKWQDCLTPLWRRIAGGCHLNRSIDRLLALGGFEITELDRGYTAGLRVAAYLYRGLARPRGNCHRPAGPCREASNE
jgi:ubiquinone/menaquinone biosynthesis C-methylase UbiE